MGGKLCHTVAMSKKPTFNSKREALSLPAPERGKQFIEYPHLSVPQFKLRVHPPDADGNVKRQYAIRIKYRGPDAQGKVRDIEDRGTFGLVEALHKTDVAIDYRDALQLALARIKKVETLRSSPEALQEAVAQAKRPTVATAWALRNAQFRAKRPTTKSKENGNYERYLLPLSERFLDELDNKFWDGFIDDLASGRRIDPQDAEKRIKGKPLREASIVGVLNTASSLYEAAQLSDPIPGRPMGWNPAKLTKKHSTRKPAKRRHYIPLLKLGEVWRAADTLCAPWARDQLRVYLLTGLRRSLLAELRFDEVDFGRKRFLISPHKQGTKRRAADLDENSPAIRIPVCDTVLGIIKARQEFAPDSKGPVWYVATPLRGATKRTDAIHADPRSNWAHLHERILSGRRFTPHDCRRTFATASVPARAELMGVSLLLLHSPRTVARAMGLPDITLDYINTAEAQQHMREACEAVEKYVLGLVAGTIIAPAEDPELPPEIETAIAAPD